MAPAIVSDWVHNAGLLPSYAMPGRIRIIIVAVTTTICTSSINASAHQAQSIINLPPLGSKADFATGFRAADSACCKLLARITCIISGADHTVQCHFSPYAAAHNFRFFVYAGSSHVVWPARHCVPNACQGQTGTVSRAMNSKLGRHRKTS